MTPYVEIGNATTPFRIEPLVPVQSPDGGGFVPVRSVQASVKGSYFQNLREAGVPMSVVSTNSAPDTGSVVATAPPLLVAFVTTPTGGSFFRVSVPLR